MDLDLWDWFRKGKTHIIAKFHKTDLIICSHSREWKTPSYSRINMVTLFRLEPILGAYGKSADCSMVNTVCLQKALCKIQ